MTIMTQKTAKGGTQMTAHDQKALAEPAGGQSEQTAHRQMMRGETEYPQQQFGRQQVARAQSRSGSVNGTSGTELANGMAEAGMASHLRQQPVRGAIGQTPAMASRTLAREATFQGIGLHSGQSVTMRIQPAPAGHGILFRRTDLPAGRGDMPALWNHVVDTRLCTRLGNADGASVGTIEHVMAALAGCGVTDALILLDGPEVPIMDGSSAPFVKRLASTGCAESDTPISAIRILAPVEVVDGDRRAALLPAEQFEMDFSIEFDDPAIGSSRRMLRLTGDAFARELGDCRTFGHLSEVERLRASGLGRGGSLQNAIVVDGGRVLNPDGLRRPDEFVRHKMLDAVGDLALAGAPIIGRYEAHRSGHELTNNLLHALFARPDAWQWEALKPGQWFDGVGEAPCIPLGESALAV